MKTANHQDRAGNRQHAPAKWQELNDKPFCRGEWKLQAWLMTPVGLGLYIKSNTSNSPANSRWDLLDMLNLLREIALQSDCLMPLVARIPGNNNDLIRRQDLHRGRYMLLDKVDKKALSHLLTANTEDFMLGADDVRLEVPKSSPWADLKNKAANKLGETAAARLVELSDADKDYDQHLIGQEEKDPVEAGRIRSVTIKNFKGIKEKENIDLDADIILVTGANGHGKSSFVEAINLALSGYLPSRPASAGTKEGRIPEHYFFYEAKEFFVRLAMENRKSGRDSKPLTVEVTGKRNEKKNSLTGVYRIRHFFSSKQRNFNLIELYLL